MKNLLLLTAVAALAAGCATSESSVFEESVKMNSMPEGATLYVNGEMVGQTPMTLTLAKDSVYEVKMTKKGYKNDITTLAPNTLDPFIKFGPLVDMGYYKQISPDSVDVQLKPDFLPSYPGVNAFGDMVSNIEKADVMRKNGEITPEEHSYLIEQITTFYTTEK